VPQSTQKISVPAAGVDRLAVEVIEQIRGRDRVVVVVEMLEHQEGADPLDAAVDRPGPGAGTARLVDEKVSSGRAGFVGDEVQARDQRSSLVMKMVPQALDRWGVLGAGFP
jgi:hypothetical protein